MERASEQTSFLLEECPAITHQGSDEEGWGRLRVWVGSCLLHRSIPLPRLRMHVMRVLMLPSMTSYIMRLSSRAGRTTVLDLRDAEGSKYQFLFEWLPQHLDGDAVFGVRGITIAQRGPGRQRLQLELPLTTRLGSENCIPGLFLFVSFISDLLGPCFSLPFLLTLLLYLSLLFQLFFPILTLGGSGAVDIRTGRHMTLHGHCL